MLTMIEHEVVDKRGWLTHDELMDIFAIAESTPGAISINIATFIGTKREGVLGGIITTLGVVLPSFLVILALSYVIDIVRDNKWVTYLFMGVRVGVIVLIVNGALKFLKGMKRTPLAIILAVAMFCLAVFTEISVIYLMLGSIGISIIAVALTHIIKKRSLISTMTKCGGDYERKRSDGNLCPDAMLAVNMQAAETELCESLPDSGEEEKTCDNAEQTDNSSETKTAEHDDADKPDGVETDDVQTANTESNDDAENGVAENAENKEDGE